MPRSEHVTRLEEALENALPSRGELLHLTFRSMFGGSGAYVNGLIIATVSNVGLGLKLSEADQKALMAAEPEAKYLQYDPDMPPSKHYILIPAHLIAQPDLLEPWVLKSIKYVEGLPIKPPKKAKKRAN